MPVSRRPVVGRRDDDAHARSRASPRGRGGAGRPRRSGRRRPGIRHAGPPLALGGDQVTHQGCHLLTEPAHVVGVVGAQDVGGHPLLEGEPGELLGPVRGSTAQEAAPRPERPRDVVEPTHRLGCATGLRRRLVDPRVHRPERVGCRVALAGQPAVGEPPGEPQHPRLVGTDPDADRVRRRRPGVQPARPVVPAVHPHAALAHPHRADDADRLLERVDGLTRREPHPTRGLDAVPERPGADARARPGRR